MPCLHVNLHILIITPTISNRLRHERRPPATLKANLHCFLQREHLVSRLDAEQFLTRRNNMQSLQGRGVSGQFGLVNGVEMCI